MFEIDYRFLIDVLAYALYIIHYLARLENSHYLTLETRLSFTLLIKLCVKKSIFYFRFLTSVGEEPPKLTKCSPLTQ